MRRRSKESGNVALEFTLVGIPVLFVLISVINVAYTMMTMHTMQESVEQGARFASAHGSGCTTDSNTCTITLSVISKALASYAAGVDPSQLSLTLTTASGAATACNPVASCFSNTTVWPPSSNSDNQSGKDIILAADYPVRTVIALFWPGVGVNQFGQMTLHAYSRQRITF